MILVGATIYFPEQAREIMRRSTVESVTPRMWESYRERQKHGDAQIRALRNQLHTFKDSDDVKWS